MLGETEREVDLPLQHCSEAAITTDHLPLIIRGCQEVRYNIKFSF